MSLFGERLRALRKEKGLTTVELGLILDTANSSISRYETTSREPKPEFILKVSEYFDVTTDYLLGKSDIKKISEDDNEIVNKIKRAVIDMSKAEKDKMIKLLEISFNEYF